MIFDKKEKLKDPSEIISPFPTEGQTNANQSEGLEILSQHVLQNMSTEELEKYSDRIYEYYDKIIAILNSREEEKIKRTTCRNCGGDFEIFKPDGLLHCKKCGKLR